MRLGVDSSLPREGVASDERRLAVARLYNIDLSQDDARQEQGKPYHYAEMDVTVC